MARPVVVCALVAIAAVFASPARADNYWVAGYGNTCDSAVLWTPQLVSLNTCVNVCAGKSSLTPCPVGSPFQTAYFIATDDGAKATVGYACNSLCSLCQQTAVVPLNTCFSSLNFTGQPSAGPVGNIVVSANKGFTPVAGILYSDIACNSEVNKIYESVAGTCVQFAGVGRPWSTSSVVINVVASSVAVVGPFNNLNCAGTPDRISLGPMQDCTPLTASPPYSMWVINAAPSLAGSLVVPLVAAAASLLLAFR